MSEHKPELRVFISTFSTWTIILSTNASLCSMLDSFSSSILIFSLLKYSRYLGDTESLSFIIYCNDLSYKLKRGQAWSFLSARCHPGIVNNKFNFIFHVKNPHQGSLIDLCLALAGPIVSIYSYMYFFIITSVVNIPLSALLTFLLTNISPGIYPSWTVYGLICYVNMKGLYLMIL